MGIRRPILVDDLDGTAHRAYGGLPNMTWVIKRGGAIAMASWTVASNVKSFVDRLRDVRRDAFFTRLEGNGHEAVAQWNRAEQIMRGGRGPGT